MFQFKILSARSVSSSKLRRNFSISSILHISKVANDGLGFYLSSSPKHSLKDFETLIADLQHFIHNKNEEANAVISLTNHNKILNSYKSSINLLDGKNKALLTDPSDQESNSLGMIVFVKDNFTLANELTTCASRTLHNFVAPYTATVVRLLKESGATIMGKTNLDEFAMGSTNTNSFFGNTINTMSTSKGLETTKLLSQNNSASNDTSNKQNGQTADAGELVYSKLSKSVRNTSSRCLDKESRSSGGSSGGSAVAVASRFCHAALGSDTGGSVRLPASWCGVVGFKPSYGRCSRYGLIDYANSFDTVGILAENVATASAIYKSLNKHDDKDMTCITQDSRVNLDKLIGKRDSLLPGLSKEITSLKGLRIGIPKEYYISEIEDSVLSAWKSIAKLFESLGATVEQVSLPHTKYSLSAYYTLATAEASSNLAKYDGVRYGYKHEYQDQNQTSYSDNQTISKSQSQSQQIIEQQVIEKFGASAKFAATRSFGFGQEVQSRIMLGNYVLSLESFKEYYEQAQKVRTLVIQDFDEVFRLANERTTDFSDTKDIAEDKYDLILVPTSASTAPLLSKILGVQNSADERSTATTNITSTAKTSLYVDDVMTVPMSLAGLPAVSIAVGVSRPDGLPIGLQLAGQFGDDGIVLRVASVLEAELKRRSSGKHPELEKIIPLVPKVMY